MELLETVEPGDRGVHQLQRVAAETATYVGAAVALVAALFGVVVVVRTLFWGGSPAGYPSLLLVVLLLGGAQLMFLGVIGEYLGRVFNETKQRPLYLVERYLPAHPVANGAVPAMSDTLSEPT